MHASDERPHEPSDARGWSESWHLDVATGDGVGICVRLATWPGLGVAWWWTYLVRPDLPGPVVVRDHEVPLPRQGLEIRADGLRGELACETPFEHWTYGLEAFGVALDDPADALRGEIGERMPIGLDIEWEIDEGAASPHERAAEGSVRGYSQLGAVHGELLLGQGRYEIDAIGMRSHTWGEWRFDRPAYGAWLHTPDLAATFVVIGDGRPDGHMTRGDEDRPIEAVRSETRRADGVPIAARHVVDDALEIEVEVLGLTPIPVAGANGERAVCNRALCRYELGGSAVDAENADDRVASGNGWSWWLDPG